MIKRHHANGTLKERILILNNMSLSSTCFIEMRPWHTFRTPRCSRSVEHDGNNIVRNSWHCWRGCSTLSQLLKGIRARACTNDIGPGQALRLFEGSLKCCAVFFLIKDKDWLCITDAVDKLGKRHAEINGCIDEP